MKTNFIFFLMMFINVKHVYSIQIPKFPKVCIVGTGPGNPRLLTNMASRMLKDSNAIFISSEEVGEDIKSMVEGRLIVESYYKNIENDMLADIATFLLNDKNVYRLLPKNKIVSMNELDKYKKWGVEVTVVPGVLEEEYNL